MLNLILLVTNSSDITVCVCINPKTNIFPSLQQKVFIIFYKLKVIIKSKKFQYASYEC